VRDPDGRPAPGVEVVALQVAEYSQTLVWSSAAWIDPRQAREVLTDLGAKAIPAAASTRTSANGAFRLPGLSPSRYIALARSEIHRSAVSKLLATQPGECAKVDLALARGAEIAGWILGPAGERLPGATIESTPSFDGGEEQLRELSMNLTAFASWLEENRPRRALSAADGTFALRGIPGGRQHVTAQAPGYGAEGFDDVDADERELVFRLKQGFGLAGRVRFQDGMPVPGAEVSMRPSRPLSALQLIIDDERWYGTGRQETKANGEGVFRFPTLAPDEYFLRVTAQGIQPRVLQGVRVKEGGSEKLMDVVVDPGEVLGGRIVDDRGQGLPEVTLVLAAQDAQDADRRIVLETAKDGSFLVETLKPVRYTLHVNPPGNYAAIAIEDITPGRTDLTLSLASGITLKGRVTDAEKGAGVASAQLYVESDTDELPLSGITDQGWLLRAATPASRQDRSAHQGKELPDGSRRDRIAARNDHGTA
jgi:protocatechuate 3,4-dioxygenase beta subunit